MFLLKKDMKWRSALEINNSWKMKKTQYLAVLWSTMINEKVFIIYVFKKGKYPRPKKKKKEMHIYCHQKTCTIMFTAALFIIVQNWKLPKCLSTVRWVNKSWYIHTIWPYTARRMDNLQLLTTWMDLTNRRLSKGSQGRRVQTMRFHYGL